MVLFEVKVCVGLWVFLGLGSDHMVVLVMDPCVCGCDGRFSTAGRFLPYLPIAVPKRRCREIQVDQFRIVLHTDIKYDYMIFDIDLQI